MPTHIRITIGPVSLDATLDDTPCADAIAGLLPLHAPVHESIHVVDGGATVNAG